MYAVRTSVQPDPRQNRRYTAVGPPRTRPAHRVAAAAAGVAMVVMMMRMIIIIITVVGEVVGWGTAVECSPSRHDVCPTFVVIITA